MASKNISNNVFNVSKEATDLVSDNDEKEDNQKDDKQKAAELPTELVVANPTGVVTQVGDTNHQSDTTGQVLMISMSVFSVVVLIVIATGCSIGNIDNTMATSLDS